ncbi:MAG: hypothetical protein FWF98_01075 [Dehalococcoidia bacterium]|nr:hypothetical protein [Dehalococcoidia bacterium]
MKKVALLFGAILVFSMLAGCQMSRSPIDLDKFKTEAEAAGYTVTDATNTYTGGTTGDCMIAAKGSDHTEYQIEFVVVSTTEQAQTIYQEKHSEYEAKIGTGSSSASVSFGNYSYYRLTTNGRYYVVSRTANTFLFVEASEEYKSEIAEFINSIGY